MHAMEVGGAEHACIPAELIILGSYHWIAEICKQTKKRESTSSTGEKTSV